ncbi:hypothetical protein SAMN02910456_02397 [Ruminococcaceae bacterium YRB3002]|nr:hypothetical protein SAMN02910456_02397 [Ruminococcaceae bacterium YRB3002]
MNTLIFYTITDSTVRLFDFDTGETVRVINIPEFITNRASIIDLVAIPAAASEMDISCWTYKREYLPMFRRLHYENLWLDDLDYLDDFDDSDGFGDE